jgi:hypothetical protein
MPYTMDKDIRLFMREFAGLHSHQTSTLPHNQEHKSVQMSNRGVFCEWLTLWARLVCQANTWFQPDELVAYGGIGGGEFRLLVPRRA